MSIRPAVDADRAALADLWVGAWQATMPEIDFGARRSWILDRFDRRAACGTVTLCADRDDGGLCGFAMIELATSLLEQLAVAPAAFGMGVGTALLDAAKSLSPAGLVLRVNQDNPRAIRFYRRAGFRITGEGVNPGGRLKVWDMAWTPL